MSPLEPIAVMFEYGDRANGMILRAAAALTEERLDQSFDMGPGTLRRTLIHILAGESVWLERWQGRVETPWPNEDERVSVAELEQRFHETQRRRRVFLETVNEAPWTGEVRYRDSRGSLFSASLRDMLLQAVLHSHHHRAQAVNMLRRLGEPVLELDYMMSVRRPA